MAKAEVKDVAVVDEPTDVVEAEVLSPWYVFCSTGCGFCKKAEPVVEELNNEGYDILTLDVAEPDNAKLNQELKTEYGVQCGTPWFINADTGKGVCGFREKDVLKKWLDGEDIPVPPRPTGAMPRPPFNGSTNKENIAWKKEYNAWLKDNKHMGDEWKKRQRTANQLIDSPRPNSEPPRAPLPQSTEKELDEWGETLRAWQEENKHIPNLPDPAMVVDNFKKRMAGVSQKPGVAAIPPSNAQPPAVNVNEPQNIPQLNTLDAKVQALEVKLDRILSHFGVK